MPIIGSKDLIGLSVVTKSGFVLGKIRGFEADTETQSILRYFVKNRRLTSKILSEGLEEIIISRNQVVGFNDTEMIVEDGAIKNMEKSEVIPYIGKRNGMSGGKKKENINVLFLNKNISESQNFRKNLRNLLVFCWVTEALRIAR